MRLQIVGGQAVVLTCIKCQDKVSSDKAYADLDGEPFKAYYCPACATENARTEMDAAFDGQFIQPQIMQGDWHQIDGHYGTENYPAEYFGLEEAKENYENVSGDAAWTAETVKGYGARLSASGYLDCTEWAVFDTELEAIEFLIETYGDI